MNKPITSYIADFKTSKNPKYLIIAIFLLFKQKRVFELFFGIVCNIIYRPGKLINSNPIIINNILDSCNTFLFSHKVFNRDELIHMFNNKFAIEKIPQNFFGARSETIVINDNYLIIGEYSEFGKRILIITFNECFVNDYYNSFKDVRHIHSIYQHENNLYITTGDIAKFIDLWTVMNTKISFSKHLKKKLAGYTAITVIDNELYLGSDFSTRPNYIERLSDEKKFFFPRKAFKMYTVAFLKFEHQYIVSLNKELQFLESRWVVSIFDTQRESFIYCEYLDLQKLIICSHSKDWIFPPYRSCSYKEKNNE